MRVLITGAGGGLGPAVVEEFRAGGHEVIAPGRSDADLTLPEDCRRLIAETGDIDAVVQVAGGFAPGGDAETFERMLTVNLKTSVNLFNAAIPGMRARKSGCLIAIGSRAALEPSPGVAAYAASKAALLHYVRTLAAEIRDDGIRANVVLPSVIDTEANRRAMPKADYTRWVQPAAIAKVVVWLTSPGASEVSGAAVPVYGRA